MGRSDSLSTVSANSLWGVAGRYLPVRLLSLPPGPDAGLGAWGNWGTAAPGPSGIEKERQGLSSSRATLMRLRRVLGPRRERLPRGLGDRRRGPRFWQQRGLAAGEAISGLDSTAWALAVYASPRRSPAPTQDSLPAAGQAYRVGLATHRVAAKGFCDASVTSLPPFPSFARRNASLPLLAGLNSLHKS